MAVEITYQHTKLHGGDLWGYSLKGPEIDNWKKRLADTPPPFGQFKDGHFRASNVLQEDQKHIAENLKKKLEEDTNYIPSVKDQCRTKEHLDLSPWIKEAVRFLEIAQSKPPRRAAIIRAATDLRFKLAQLTKIKADDW